jgi:ubiquinone/menaquinone biosynthesis C-methylase UbiE
MGTIEENIIAWGKGNDEKWAERGDSWSAPWGSSEQMWYGSILPRIHMYVPCAAILEIACGYGRCTQFLLKNCKELIGIDLNDNCVNACKDRFKDQDNVSFLKTDGKSIPEIENESIDFIFSWDSLVHANTEAVFGYLKEIKRILKKDGKAFINHSNLGCYNPAPDLYWRDTSVSADIVLNYCTEIGLFCFAQEINKWREPGDYFTDCFTWLSNSKISEKYNRYTNDNFWKEIEEQKRLFYSVSL